MNEEKCLERIVNFLDFYFLLRSIFLYKGNTFNLRIAVQVHDRSFTSKI